LAIGLALCLLLGGCGAGPDCGRVPRALGLCSTLPVIKVGLVAPFEGRYRSLGYEVLYAVKLAVRERNAAGGVAGYMVELVALDDGEDAASRRFLARKFAVDAQVMGVIGPFDDASLHAAADAYREVGLPLITPATYWTAPDPAGGPFCLGASPETLAGALAEAVPADARVAVLRAEVPGLEGVPSWTDHLPDSGWRVGAFEEWRALPADIYLIQGDVLASADLLIEMRGSGVRAPVLGGPMLARTQLSQIAGQAVEGACHAMTVPFYADRAAGFVAGYQELGGGDPGPWAVLAYDASTLLLDALQQAIESAGEPTREGVAAALAQVRGPDGEPVFEGRQRRQAEMALYCYEAGDPYPGSIVSGR
jgi:ABC-type branched-subunit amino acid transport system substrate-binding protein